MCVEDSSGGNAYSKRSRQGIKFGLAMSLVKLGALESDTDMGAKDFQNRCTRERWQELLNLGQAKL